MVVALACLNGVLWFVIGNREPGTLQVSVLDVGQGDAIFIESPTGTQVLIDGGRGRAVLRELGKEMSLFDRSIDMVVETHPDADHIGGLPGVFARYRVGYFLSPDIEHETGDVDALEAAIEAEDGAARLVAHRGMRFSLGGGAVLDILYPDRGATNLETNTGSIVARVSYGDTAFMLTGDAPSSVEDWLVALDGEALQSDVLKAGHHGSKTSTGDAWLAAVSPAFVAISAGKDNPYGHPAPETLERVRASGARIVSTIDDGTLEFVSDGRSVSYR